jgi:hypothetical protein
MASFSRTRSARVAGAWAVHGNSRGSDYLTDRRPPRAYRISAKKNSHAAVHICRRNGELSLWNCLRGQFVGDNSLRGASTSAYSVAPFRGRIGELSLWNCLRRQFVGDNSLRGASTSVHSVAPFRGRNGELSPAICLRRQIAGDNSLRGAPTVRKFEINGAARNQPLATSPMISARDSRSLGGHSSSDL